MKKTLRIWAVALALIASWGCHPDEIALAPELTPEEADDPDRVDWDDAMRYVFDESVVPEIHVTVSEAEWNRLLKAYDANHNTQEFVRCDVLYRKGDETTVIGDAGLRLKGNTSRRRPEGNDGQKHNAQSPNWHHCHFGLDFHEYEKDPAHTVHGLRRVDLKWFKDDPAYVREIYCYDLFRRFGVWTAVRDVYARLWIKVGDGEEAYFGVYGMLEHIDKNYVRSRKGGFGHKGGNLWKCRYPADLRKTNADMGVDDDLHDHTYELKTNKEEGFEPAKAQLQHFIRNLNSLSGPEFNTWIASVTDVDLFLRTLAVNVAVGMWDDYWNNMNNYYLYFDKAEGTDYQVFFIPYDYDNTLGTSANCGVQSDSGRQDPLAWGNSAYPLTSKILKNEIWKARYKAYLKELCDGPFNMDASQARIRIWQSMVRPFVTNDTGEDQSISDRPASWSNHGEYRLLDKGANNFFRVKAASVASMK